LNLGKRVTPIPSQRDGLKPMATVENYDEENGRKVGKII